VQHITQLPRLTTLVHFPTPMDVVNVLINMNQESE